MKCLKIFCRLLAIIPAISVSAAGWREFECVNAAQSAGWFAQASADNSTAFLIKQNVGNSVNSGPGATSARVVNLGKGGLSSWEILNKKLPEALILKPQTTVLLAGTNDMINSGKLASYKSYEDNLQQIITRLKDAGSQVILVTIPPCSERLLFKRHRQEAFGRETPSERIIKANQIVRKLAENNQCRLVDFYQIVRQRGDVDGKASLIRNPANGGGEDGVHPGAEGYKILAGAIFAIIKDENLPAGKIVCLGDSITCGAGVKGEGTAAGETYPGKLAELLSESLENQNIK